MLSPIIFSAENSDRYLLTAFLEYSEYTSGEDIICMIASASAFGSSGGTLIPGLYLHYPECFGPLY